MSNTVCCRGPDEPSPFQPFGKQAEPLTIPAQNLDRIALTPAKHKKMTGKNILVQNLLYQH